MNHSLYTIRKAANRIAIKCSILVLSYLALSVSTANAQSASLDQGANGKRTAPTTPVDWINGNLNTNQVHFLEGYSVPCRTILKSLIVNKTYTIAIGYDVRANGKNAMDYLTQYDRLDPHEVFGHTVESVNPLLNITGFAASYFTSTDTYPIPPPSSAGADVAGMPTTSFNALAPAKRVITGYNADITNITYASEGSLSASSSETVILITFIAQKATAVLAWGGHLASIADWGRDPSTGETRSASSITGSPYHTRLKYWIIDGVISNIGNQDKSVKTDAVYIPPVASATGPLNACTTTPSLTYTSTVDDAVGLTYLWSIVGSNTANAKIVNNTLATIQVVPIGSQFTTGTFNLRLIVTRNGFNDTCFINGDVTPGANVTIETVTANAGADQSISDLETAQLQAAATGSSGTISYSWSPATNLSDANIANPVFTPPATGAYQYIVTATSQYGCTGKDTVVITVTPHVKPPCSVNGADPVCPGSTNPYTGPASNVSAWLWSVSGGASIVGANNGQSVSIKADNACGNYTLQLITTASNGIAKDTCTTTIQVSDAIAPVLSGSVANQTVSCSKNLPAIPQVTATDNCDPGITVSYVQTVSDSICVNKYTLSRKWWAVDKCGNTSDTLRQTIVVNDDVKPVITTGFNSEVNVQCLKDVPTAPVPTATDNCDDSLQPVYSEEGAGSACDSTITRKWIFTDACGNSDFVTQTIHIKDNTVPVLVGSVSNVNIACTKDIPAVANITATDNCDQNVTVQHSQVTTDSTCINKYTLTRKWWAVDACGNISETLTQIIVVNDDVKPVITADFTKEINVQCLKDVPAAPVPTATDNCDENLQPVYSEEGSGSACDSTITRKWTFTDACGNSDFVTQTIHIKDNTIPVLVGSVSNVNIACTKDIPAVADITATDNCDQNVTVQYNQNTSDSTCVNKYTLTRRWWAVDACGNTSETMTQIIVVNDDVKPAITADFTKEINVQCLKDVPAAPAPTATDNCDDSLQPVYSEEGSGSACDSTITRKWTFTDACGNSDFVIQTIHIKDNTVPVLVGSVSNANVSCTKDIPAIADITANDNCDQNVTVQYSQVTTDSTCINKYTLTRKWWAVDACGNTSETMTQIIVVNDDVKPVISADFSKEINVQCLKDVPAAPVPTATDNCDDSVQPVYSEEGSGSACDSTITRKWTFTDACGNSDFVIQTIHIKDNTVPVLVGSVSNVNIACTRDIPAVANITATDNCDQNVTVQYSQTTSDSTCINKYTLTRKWWVVDACGNTSETMVQTIIINDDVKPVIAADFTKEINVQCMKDVPAAPVPTATDNCDESLQPVYSEEGSGSACDSTITRKWTFTDACGNSDFVTQTIHIKDNTIPVLVGSVSNVNIACTKDIPAVADITATDNCDQNVTVQYNQITSDSTCVNKYTLTRKWWAVDACGNTSETMTQIIVVNDDVKPAITADFTKEINVQCMKDVPAAPAPTATDNCDDSLQPVYSEEGSGSACDSTITRKWTFTDACGNSDFVIQTIHIKDNTAPVLVGSVSNVNIACTRDIPAVANITATDNCDQNVTVQYSQVTTDSTCINKYTLTRKWWAVDACGNTSETMVQTIIINDDVKPVIAADFTKEINVQCLKDVPAAPVPTATDNCDDSVQPVYSEDGSGSACDSTITRKWTFTDACGNSDFVTQVIHIKDNTIPVLVGSVSNVNIACTRDIPAVADITATDNCDQNITVQYSQVTSDSTCINKYTLTRKWWAVDVCGNTSATMTQIIVVNDDVKPVITADFTKEINVQCLKDVPAAPVPTATDNCDDSVQPVYSEEGSGSACDSTITRKWTFTDACGNSDFVTQVIHIKDNTIPVLVGSVSNVNIACTRDIPAVADITATDNCDDSVQPVYSEEGSGSACDSTITRKWTFTDACGNSDFVTQVIHIKDNTIPVLVGSVSNVNIACTRDIPAVADITATDNCDQNITVQYSQVTSDSSCVNKYTLTRKWWAVDACGNTSETMTQIIVVNDDVKPVITADFTKEINVQCLKDVPAAPVPTATDNCDDSVQPVYSEEGSGSACDSTITRKWTFTDACGNSDFITQVIHIKDNTVPVLVGSVSNVNIACTRDIPAVANITATDNCDQNVTVQYSQVTTDSTCINKYTLTRKWWAVDACGNTSETMVQTIIINDDVKPVIAADFTKEINVQCLKDVPAAPVPTATDNCDDSVQPVYSEEGSGNACDSTITRKWTFTDACGNSDFVIQTIHIKDNTIPVLVGSVSNVNIACTKDIPAVAGITVTDNCDQNVAVQYSQTTSDSTCVNKYTLTRKWWAVDACGNTSETLTQIIVVNDDVKPVIAADFTKEINVQCLKDVPAAPVPTATDNCDDSVQPVYSEEGSGNACDSTITRKWTFTDACGNSDFVTQVIRIKDNTVPVLVGSVSNANVSCTKDIPAVANIAATDNCDQNITVQYSQVTSDSICVNKYTLTRKWWAVDACGNTSETMTQIIVVNDDVKPAITADFTKEINVQCLKDVPAAPVPTATDNCDDSVQPVYSEEGSGSACDSTITRKWTFTDACGNSDFVTQTIHIKDNTIPVLVGSVSNVNIACTRDIPAVADITATDNCDQNITVQYSQVTSDSTCVNKYTLTRKWWAVDVCGNTSETMTQIIVVNDDVKPVITADFTKEINVQCMKDVPAAPVPTATDNCDDSVQPVYSEEGSGNACDSTITRKWTFTDACGNSDFVTQVIHIKDNTIPVLVGSVSNVNIVCTRDIPAVADITATDNCDQNITVQYSQVTSDSTCVNKYTLTRKWWAVDVCGNTSETMTQIIVVNDDVKPVITADFTKEINVQCMKDVPAAPVPTATDNCDDSVQPVYSEEGSGSACDSTITRKWTFTDACGNSDFVTQVIHIKDNTIPVLVGSVSNVNIACTKDIPAVADITATDNCDQNITVQYSQVTSDSTCVNKYTLTRKWWAVDVCGNTSETMTQIIVVNDDVKPVITADFTKEINVQCMKDVPAAPVPTATDNCDDSLQPVYSEEGTGTTCDSTITRTWTFTDACGNSSFVKQVIHIKDITAPVLSGSANNITVNCVNDIPAVANITATDNCSGTLQPAYSQQGSGNACDSVITRKWIFTDACGNSDSITQIIHIKPSGIVTMTGSVKDMTVASIADVPAPQVMQAAGSCSAATVHFSQTVTDSACVNKLVITRKWWAIDDCGYRSNTMVQTITVNDNIAPVATNVGQDRTQACQTKPVFDEPVFTDNSNLPLIVTYTDNYSNTACPQLVTRTWKATDACGNVTIVQQAVTIPCCNESICTYTQGFYGTPKASVCVNGGGTTTSNQIMISAVDKQPGDSAIFGLKSTGRYFTLHLNDVAGGSIFEMLPGGGKPAALKGYATYTKPGTWNNVPMSDKRNSYGKIENGLLTQAMTLFFNINNSTNVGGLKIEGDSLFTAKETTCGSGIAVDKEDIYVLPKNVVAYLRSTGENTAQGLLDLANRYLGGQLPADINAGELTLAMEILNSAFDGCRILKRWSNSPTPLIHPVPALVNTCAGSVQVIGVFPNPYVDKVYFRFIAPQTGTAVLEVWNLLGQELTTIRESVTQCNNEEILYNVSIPNRVSFAYRLSVGNTIIKTGIVICTE